MSGGLRSTGRWGGSTFCCMGGVDVGSFLGAVAVFISGDGGVDDGVPTEGDSGEFLHTVGG